MPCSNVAKTRNPLKFAGVPQTGKPISAASGPKFPYYQDMWRRYCCLTGFFRLSIHALVPKIHPDKVVRWCPDGDFLVLSAKDRRKKKRPQGKNIMACPIT